MWATLAMAAAVSLAPGQAGDLKLSNARTTYGILGQKRTDTKLLPGDILFLSFDIENLKVKDDGVIQYSIGMELYSKKEKKVVFTQEPEDSQSINSLGGSRRPAFAMTQIGVDTPAGDYTITVKVKDRASGKSAEFSKDFQVMPLQFGFTRVGFGNDTGGPAPPVAVAGQTLIINFALVGFELKKPKDAKDPKAMEPNIAVEMRLLEDGKTPTVPKPFSFTVTEVKEDYKRLAPMQFFAQLNRSGKFKVEITATDLHSGKKATQALDLEVLPDGSR